MGKINNFLFRAIPSRQATSIGHFSWTSYVEVHLVKLNVPMSFPAFRTFKLERPKIGIIWIPQLWRQK